MAIPNCPETWGEWTSFVSAGLDARCRYRMPVVLAAMVLARGRRTVASWLRAAGVTMDFKRYYYFIASVGRKTPWHAGRVLHLALSWTASGDRLLFGLDDTPTKRYGPEVEGAGIHHNPTPGPADAKYVYGHIWVTLALLVRHARWGTLGLPVLSELYIRRGDVARLPRRYRWPFQTKLQQAVNMIRWLARQTLVAGKRLWIVADGFYAKREVIREARKHKIVFISRLRKDAALQSVPEPPKPGQPARRGRRRKYGPKRISLARRAAQPGGWQKIECVQYGNRVTKTIKSFLATYVVADGRIRVVIVREAVGVQYFFSTEPDATPEEILEAFADRAAIEQVFHDLKEVEGAGQQQVRHLWANLGTWHLNLWSHTLSELWAWRQSHAQVCDRRASPWDDPKRRPSHADRRKALGRQLLRDQYSYCLETPTLARKIRRAFRKLLALAT